MAERPAAIDATVTLVIDHVRGPVVADADHVRVWLVADGAWLEGGHNGFTFEVCPTHSDPECCDCTAEMSTYRAMISAVESGDGD